MIVLLAVSAGAMNVQVIEGDADGAWDLSAKKLRAMATVYLAELGHVPCSGNTKFVTLVDDTTGLLLVTSQEKVEFYSSYISGMDERYEVVGRKYVYVDMRKEKVYKKVDYPLSKPMNWDVISDSLLLFYWDHEENGKYELTKALAWNYHSNVLENWSIVSKEPFLGDVDVFLAPIRSNNDYRHYGYAIWGGAVKFPWLITRIMMSVVMRCRMKEGFIACK